MKALGIFLTIGLCLQSAPAVDVFARSNLIAWCIVPFDSQNRGPEERAAMLEKLGIRMLAYDWRDKHIPTFDEEADALARHHVKLQAFWLTSGPDPAGDRKVGVVLDFLRRRGIHTQLWYMFVPPKNFEALTQEQKVEMAAKAVGKLASMAAQIGCSVGMYNHGGWYGEPENQLAVLERLKLPNVGLVYNFHHAHAQIDRFPEFFPKMRPHLMALNLAGLRKGDREVYAVGGGDRELEMMRLIRRGGYRGPIGIINERIAPDAEVGLKMNLDGMKKLLTEMGDKAALQTY
jgi:sugar phosphate isomerase/epimerase